MKIFLTTLFSNNYPRWLIKSFDFLLIFFVFNFSSLLFSNELLKFSLNETILLSFIFIITATLFKCYEAFIRHYGFTDFLKIAFASVFVMSLFSFFDLYQSKLIIEKSIIQFFLLSNSVIVYRLFIKSIFYKFKSNLNENNNTLIISAGQNGILIKRSFSANKAFNIIGFIDDDPNKINRKIDGVKIYSFESIQNLFARKQIKNIIFSTNKFTSARRKMMTDFFKSYNVNIYNISDPSKWLNKKPSLKNLQKIKIEDILSRPEVSIDFKSNFKFYNDKVILITGAAGSIGSELARQIIEFKPKKLILIDNSETSLFKIINEFSSIKSIEFCLMNILNSDELEKIFIESNIDFVFHAAAYKHVPILEYSAKYGAQNNIIGTNVVIDLSLKYNIYKLLIVSTDKAVRPTNVMGATKRICELLPHTKENYEKTNIITTRFGNVMGSNGSVIPIFTNQILNGGPVTVTHKDITRFFMTISEASKLVIEACRLGLDNQIFIFDMGQPVKISDLASKMIALTGFEPNKDIEIKYVGLRPGEKLYEELLTDTENLLPSSNSHIFIAEKDSINSTQKNKIIELLEKLSDSKSDNLEIVSLMKMIIPEFISNNSKFSELDND